MLPGMLPRSAGTDAFWQALRRYAGLDHDNYAIGSFGDSPEMATELAHLVITGTKRATASFALRASLAASPPSLALDYGEGREPMPKPDDVVMMLDGEGRPRFIWRTTEVTIKLLSQVDEAFARGRGERGSYTRLVARCPSPLFRPGNRRVKCSR
jgi:uncharacterized protein YhfF